MIITGIVFALNLLALAWCMKLQADLDNAFVTIKQLKVDRDKIKHPHKVDNWGMNT